MKTKDFRFSRILVIILLMFIATKVHPQKLIFDENQFSKRKHIAVIEDLLNGFNSGASATIQVFHKDALIEFPYANSLGTPSKLNRNEYQAYLNNALSNMPDMEFTGIKVYTINRNSFWAEFHGEFTVPTTKKRYVNDYVVKIELKKGKIINLKEYWNPLAVIAFGDEKQFEKIFKK